jgi:hypothetical protein
MSPWVSPGAVDQCLENKCIRTMLIGIQKMITSSSAAAVRKAPRGTACKNYSYLSDHLLLFTAKEPLHVGSSIQ